VKSSPALPHASPQCDRPAVALAWVQVQAGRQGLALALGAQAPAGSTAQHNTAQPLSFIAICVSSEVTLRVHMRPKLAPTAVHCNSPHTFGRLGCASNILRPGQLLRRVIR
jgi:hypothetical protein